MDVTIDPVAIREQIISELRQAAEANYGTADKKRTEADKMQAEVNELRARAGYFTAMADRWTRLAALIENGTFDIDYLLSGDDLDEARRAADVDPVTGPDYAEAACGRCAEPGHQTGDCETILDDSVVPIMPGDDYDDHREGRYTEAQLDGQACAECGVDFAEYAPTVPTGFVIDGGQLFAHIACTDCDAEDFDPSATGRRSDGGIEP